MKSNCYSLIYSSLYWILFYWYIIGLYSSHPFSSLHYISLNKSELQHCNLKLLLWHLLDTNVCCNSCSQLQPISVKGAAWNHSIAAHSTSDWYSVWLNPTRGRGADSARPEQKLRFWYILVIPLTQKNWLFPNSYDNASHTLSGYQNGLKMGFYSIFVVSRTKIWILKCVFWPFLGLK